MQPLCKATISKAPCRDVRLFAHARMYVCMHACMHACTPACVRGCMYACVRCTPACVRGCMYACEQPHLCTEKKSRLQGTVFWGPEVALPGKRDRK